MPALRCQGDGLGGGGGEFSDERVGGDLQQFFAADAEIEVFGEAVELNSKGAAEADEGLFKADLRNIHNAETQNGVHQHGFHMQHAVEGARIGEDMLDDFAAAYRGEGQFRASGEDGVRNMLVLDAAYRSWRSGRRELVG